MASSVAPVLQNCGITHLYVWGAGRHGITTFGVVSDYVIAAANLQIGAKQFQCYIYIQISTMSTGNQIDVQFATYFLTSSIVDWIDIFTRSGYHDIIIVSFNYCIRENRQKLNYIHKKPVRAG